MQMWHTVWTASGSGDKNLFPISACDWPGKARLSLFARSEWKWNQNSDGVAKTARLPRAFLHVHCKRRRGRSSTSRRFSYRSRGCRYAFSPSRHQALVALDAASPFASRRSQTASITRICDDDHRVRHLLSRGARRRRRHASRRRLRQTNRDAGRARDGRGQPSLGSQGARARAPVSASGAHFIV